MKKKQLIRRLLSYARPYRGYLALALLFAILQVTLTLLGPVLVGRGIDLVVGPGQVDFRGLVPLLGALAATIALGALFQWLMALYTTRLTQGTVKGLRVDVFRHLQEAPLATLDRHAHGDLMSRVVNDVEQIADGLLQGATQLFTGVVTIVGTLIFMLTLQPVIALVVVLVTPLSLFVASFIARRSHRLFTAQSRIRGELGGYVEEMVAGGKVVKLFRYEARAGQAFRNLNEDYYRCGLLAQFYSSMANPCTRFVNGIVYALVGVIGALQAIQGRMTVGQISCFLSYANQYTKPFNEISGVVTELQTAFASASRVFAILDEPSQTPDAPDARVLTDCDGRVDIRDLSFSYTPETPLIQHFTQAVPPGSRVAIVGPTGCGKTTFINLLMRFYEPTGGEIAVSGTPIQRITRDSLRTTYGMVLQDTWLTQGTVRDNIAYGREDATEEEVVAAAQAAYAHSFITRLPQGYDTVIDENGGTLSQGQKQLLCIARVMLMDPAMLILDEATSSIDTRTELHIQAAMDRMMQGRTSFVVAHRLSTIRGADVILVMNHGQIIEQGAHDELLAQGGFYARLYHSQFEATEAR